MKEVLNRDPGEVAGMLKDPCYTRKELAKVLVTTKRRLEEAQNSRDAAWKEAAEAKEKVGSLEHRAVLYLHASTCCGLHSIIQSKLTLLESLVRRPWSLPTSIQ